MSNKKPIFLDPLLLEQLLKLPDLIYQENLDLIPKSKLLALMEALDDTSDHINDFLTDSGFNILLNNHNAPDIEQ